MPFNFNLKKSSFDFPSHDKSHSIHQARCRKNTQSTGAISNIAIKPPESIDHVRCIQDDVFLCFIHKVLFGSIDDAIMMNLSVLLDGSLEGGRVGTDDLADLLAVLEDEESGHGADGVLLGGLGDLVDVNLEEAGVGVVVGEPVGGGVVSEGVLVSSCI
jgi:hypothetical protein